MTIVLLSGGSGKRLWPLSNETNSKQFLRILRDDDGERESMVHRVYRQLRQVEPRANVLVSTNESQLALVRKQLGEKIDVCLEPSRRNTFPAIVLAAAYLRYRKNGDANDKFIVLPIDVYAELRYFECLREMLNNPANVTLMGVTPTFPTSKYGYILTDNGAVAGFKEKPSKEEAMRLIENGALWNCGVFSMNIGYILEIAKKYIDISSYDSVVAQFDKLPINSFDYEVLEHEKSIGYVTYDGMWKDIGTWNTLTEELSENIDPLSNVQLGEGCENTHVLNMLGKPIVALGVSNAVIVASNDGILVSDKRASGKLKTYADTIKQRPMYEQRQWGNYRVLDYVKNESGTSLTKRMKIDAGKAISYQAHKLRSEFWVFISGEGVVTIDGMKQVVERGSIVTIPVGAKHKIAAATDIEFVEIQIGDADLEETDTERG